MAERTQGVDHNDEARAYAFGRSGELLRLRLPFAFFNTGAQALIVGDLRVVLADEPGRPELRWATTRDRLRPEPDGFHRPTPAEATTSRIATSRLLGRAANRTPGRYRDPAPTSSLGRPASER